MGSQSTKMKLLLPLAAQCLAGTIDSYAPGDCHWITGGSGDFIQCLPDFYIDATCGSGSREDCRFMREGEDGTAQMGKYAFGIHCCPATKQLPVGAPDDCQWYGANTGENAECPGVNAAFGRCSTNKSVGGGGDCNKLGHQVQCCTSAIHTKPELCGWLYDTYGTKLSCPNGQVAAGFCGTNNKADCNDGHNFVGIRCCPTGR